jgi:tetratricopeptide (TPR) repeat protein
LQAIPAPGRAAAEQFLRLAGLFDPLIPWDLLLQYLREVEKMDVARLEANLREHFIGPNGQLEWVTDNRPNAPESQHLTYVRYANPLLAADQRPSENRTQWAKELLRKLRAYSPPNRHTAQLFLHLAAQAGDSESRLMCAELGWWLDEQYAYLYEAVTNMRLQMGLVTTNLLVDTVMKNQDWPMHRRRAVLNACKQRYAQQGNIPSQVEACDYWYLTGWLEREVGNYRAGVFAFQQQLKIEQMLFPPESSKIAATLNNLAALYDDQGDYAEALPLHLRSLAIREKVLGAEYPDVATSLNNLAALYEAQDDYAQALPLLERAIRIAEQKLGAEHPLTQRCRRNYEECREALGAANNLPS